MTARPDTWMPLYIKDYLADTRKLTQAQHGAYLLLIMEYWRTAGPLPDDDRLLAKLALVGQEKWKKQKLAVMGFFTLADGFWHHKRVDVELAKAAEIYEKSRIRTSAATAARSQRNVQRNVQRDENVTDNVTFTQPQPQPQPHLKNDLGSRPLSPEMRKRLGVTLSDEKLAQLERENAARKASG